MRSPPTTSSPSLLLLPPLLLFPPPPLLLLQDMDSAGTSLHPTLRDHIAINAAVNSSASVVFTGEDGETLHRPKIVGSATEGRRRRRRRQGGGGGEEGRREEEEEGI